jgi:hypothetical protein
MSGEVEPASSTGAVGETVHKRTPSTLLLLQKLMIAAIVMADCV